MRARLAVVLLMGMTLSCQSDSPLNPTASRPTPRPLASTHSVAPAPAPTATRTPSATPVTVIVIVLPTATPTPAAIATSTPSAAPTPRPTAAPAPRSTTDPTCLDLKTVPPDPVPVFTGRGCRTSEGFVPVRDPASGAEGCIRNWRCADGDDRYQPAARIGASLNSGGPGGVHRCQKGEGMGPEFICDAGRFGQEAYGRNITDGGAIIEIPKEADGRQPGAWERAGICRPLLCN
jgi:hypothetical protein